MKKDKLKYKPCLCGCESEIEPRQYLRFKWVDYSHRKHWLETSEEGQKEIVKAMRKAKNKLEKDLNDKIKEWKPNVHEKKYKAILQSAINRLAKMIDEKFGFITCIDCDKSFGNQVDGAHFHAVGGNHSIRYNLHNIHSAKSDCNKYSATHKEGYIAGLKLRYGIEYYEMVESLQQEYQYIKLTNVEVFEKTALVRGLLRNFHLYEFENSIAARDGFNEIIGIYK